MVDQFIKLNSDRKIFFYTFEWIAIPKHFKHDVIVLKDYIYTLSVCRLAMIDILYEKGGVCWTMQHNPVALPSEIDKREASCLQGCNGKLCGYCVCFDIMAVDRPKHKILCEAKDVIVNNYYYRKFGIMPTLNKHVYLDTHPSYVEYTFKDGKELSEKILDITLWYTISGYTPSVQNYQKNISFEKMMDETSNYIVIK
jgi:hypothetical protein